MKILITGGAGFIGSNLAKKLIARGDQVVIIDNFNDYYNPKLKEDRIKIYLKGCQFKLYRGDIRDIKLLDKNLPYDIINIGGDKEEKLTRFIEVVEQNLGKKAKKKLMPIQQGDVPSTVADIRKLRKLGWKPTTRIEKGIKNFMNWYREYYNEMKQSS